MTAERKSTYTILSVLAVTRGARYLSTQVNGKDAEEARRAAMTVARRWMESGDAHRLDPLFIADASGEGTPEQHSVGSYATMLDARPNPHDNRKEIHFGNTHERIGVNDGWGSGNRLEITRSNSIGGGIEIHLLPSQTFEVKHVERDGGTYRITINKKTEM